MYKTDAEIEREKRIWLEANGMVEDIMRRINSGICRTPGLASELANFAIKTASEVLPHQVFKDAEMLGAGFAMIMPDGSVKRLEPEVVILKQPEDQSEER